MFSDTVMQIIRVFFTTAFALFGSTNATTDEIATYGSLPHDFSEILQRTAGCLSAQKRTACILFATDRI